jgi:hypothetical protein
MAQLFASMPDVMKSRLNATQRLALLLEVRSDSLEGVLVRYGFQRAASCQRIESAGPPQLCLALRAELERLTVTLLRVVRAIHAALIGDMRMC